MKQAGLIYCKNGNKQNKATDHEIATRRKVAYICNPQQIWSQKAKESQYDKSQCTNATMKECNQTQLKSTSDYFQEFSSNATNPVLEETIKNCGSATSFNDSLFDSLSPFENKKPQAHAIVNKLISLQTLFKEMKELIAMEQNKKLKKDLSAVENELLSLERQFMSQ